MKTTNDKKALLAERRARHHRALETLRAPSCELSGLQIWRKLSQIESIAHNCTEAACNGERVRVTWPVTGLVEYDFRNNPEDIEHVESRVRDCVRSIFGQVPDGFFLNQDARGSALKLDSDKVTIPDGMQTDWGSDGILAAEITEV
jgi:hypothetical protein